MVSAKRNHARVVFTVKRNRREPLASGRIVTQGSEGLSLDKGFVTVLDLLNGVFVVIRSGKE